MSDESLRLQTLVSVGLRLAQGARTGRVALAQLEAAIDPAWVPPWASDVLGQLERAAEATRVPIEYTEVERVVTEAWDAAPSDELDEIDTEPVKVTPGAQIHRGVLDGDPVAIKILKPDLGATVRQDLALLEALMAPLAAAFPALDTAAIMREVRERVLEELDLEHEAATQRRFYRALRRHPFLSVPAPITRLCHEHALVSHWVDGVPLSEAPDPDRAAAQLLTFTLGAARWGVAYADPHEENTLITAGGGLAIVDFGACREMDILRLDDAIAVLEAVLADDADAVADRLSTLGWLPPEHAATALELTRAILGEHLSGGPTRLDGDAVIAVRDRIAEHASTLVDLLPVGRLAPEDLWPARGVVQLLGTIARLGATGDWAAQGLAALRDGWDGAAA